jgi:hypothetical protein
VLSTRVVRASGGGERVPVSVCKQRVSRGATRKASLIKKKKNARLGARAQLVGVTCDMLCHKIEATRHMK